jgi:hypothetical protein
MRSNIDPQKIKQLMQALGREAQGSGCIYFTGGASALLIGWRSATVDIDIRLDPEPPGIFQAIAKLKQELNINIELASPQDFLPPLAVPPRSPLDIHPNLGHRHISPRRLTKD